MLLPPQYIINTIAPKEIKELINHHVFPSIPERTKRDFIKGKRKPNQKTLESIYNDIQETTPLNLDQAKNLFSSTGQPWQCIIDMFKMGFTNSSGEVTCPGKTGPGPMLGVLRPQEVFHGQEEARS
jgi:hypothetical protein